MKTSEDGRLEGFKFSIVGYDFTGHYFNEIYTTDENGEIFVDGLRIGEYTITELFDEENPEYIVPESQNMTVEYEETLEVSFYNQLIEIPQKGDNRNLDIFIKLLILAVIGLIFFAVKQTKEYFKKKRKDKRNAKVHSKSNNKNNR